jgi:hypothetical protein
MILVHVKGNGVKGCSRAFDPRTQLQAVCTLSRGDLGEKQWRGDRQNL